MAIPMETVTMRHASAHFTATDNPGAPPRRRRWFPWGAERRDGAASSMTASLPVILFRSLGSVIAPFSIFIAIFFLPFLFWVVIFHIHFYFHFFLFRKNCVGKNTPRLRSTHTFSFSLMRLSFWQLFSHVFSRLIQICIINPMCSRS